MTLSRRKALALLREEEELILERAGKKQADPRDHLPWYLKLSKNWGVVLLDELAKQPTGTLLDVGAFTGLISGAACRLGWQVSAVDLRPIPDWSGLCVASRQVRRETCNVCVDPLPFESASFDAVLLLEVLEHLPYSPLLLFREIRRVLRPGGRLYLTTPNPASPSRIVSLVRGGNPMSPPLEYFLDEHYTTHKGLTFFENGRDIRFWTVEELRAVLPQAGLRLLDWYTYANTVEEDTLQGGLAWRLRRRLNAAIRPLVRRSRLGGGGLFIQAEPC